MKIYKLSIMLLSTFSTVFKKREKDKRKRGSKEGRQEENSSRTLTHQ